MAIAGKLASLVRMDCLPVLMVLSIWLLVVEQLVVLASESSSADTCGLTYYDGPTPTQSDHMKLSVLKPGFNISIGAEAPGLSRGSRISCGL
jgi:hypothetical protein